MTSRESRQEMRNDEETRNTEMFCEIIAACGWHRQTFQECQSSQRNMQVSFRDIAPLDQSIGMGRFTNTSAVIMPPAQKENIKATYQFRMPLAHECDKASGGNLTISFDQYELYSALIEETTPTLKMLNWSSRF